MQKNMGLVNTRLPRELEYEFSQLDIRRNCFRMCKRLLVGLVRSCAAMRSFVMAAALLSVLVITSFAQAQQPYTSPLQPRSTEDLQQLVAPIALYPDTLVAQILAAATYPTEVVQADRWLKGNPALQGQQLATAVDQQPWDASVKAMTAFPAVLSNMDQNLAWTTELGEVYFNQQQDVMNAVQVMRERAAQAGTLRSITEERVINDGPSIIIEPAYPDVCYLPEYDPWLVYGAPLVPFPGYYYGPWLGSTFVSFGPAIRLGFFGGFGWGWPAWGFNWGNHVLVFNRVPYVSHSRLFYGRGPFVGVRGGLAGREFERNHPFLPNRWNGLNGFRGFQTNPGRRFDHSFDRSGGFRANAPIVGGRNFGGGFHGSGFHGGGGGRHR